MVRYEQYIPGYPSIEDEDFYNRIVEKKEFWIGQGGHFFQHQVNIARYMAQWTLYHSLFVYHEMGTGKSALTVVLTELAKKDKASTKVLYIAHNQTQIANYKNEVRRFSRRLAASLDHNTNMLSEEVRRKWNLVLSKDGYEFHTYGTLVNAFAKRTDAWIRDHYEDSIVIVDEAHHIVQSGKEEDKRSYHTIMRILSVLQRRRLLVMSGTPVRDQPDEIVPLLNMVLPPQKQLQRSDFIGTFFRVREQVEIFENIKIPVYEWKPEERKRFLKTVQGYVSYLKKRQTNATIRYEGAIYEPMGHIKIVAHRMDPFQNMVYTDVFRRERLGAEEEKTARSSFYSLSKQASLFVFPNEESGERGYKAYVSPQCALRPAFLQAIGDYKNMSSATILEQLRQFSASYAYTIRQILENPKELVYVFSDLVEGSGILLFMAILRTLFGFRLITSRNDLADTKGDRMILLNDSVANEDDFQDLIDYFNRPENKNGDYCQIIMSTNKTKEGISMKNVRQIHILTPSWNIADTSQAIARSIRAQSHNDLEDPVVRIFLHASMPYMGTEEDEAEWLEGRTPFTRDELMFSVDFQRYFRSEVKERNVKLLDRVFLESSWDCLMNVPHHGSTNRTEDLSRECEYDVCRYECHGVSPGTVPGSDVSNANAFYNGMEEHEIIAGIEDYFRRHHSVLLADFYNDVMPGHNRILVGRCLEDVIHRPVLLRDSHNMPCFLAHKDGFLYLTDNPYLPPSKMRYEMYYQQHPATRVDFALSELLDSYFRRNEKTILPRLMRLIQTENPNAKKLFLALPIDFQATFCETTLQTQMTHPSDVGTDFRTWFVKNFKTDIVYIPGAFLEHRFVEKKQNARRLDLKDPALGWSTPS